MHLSLIETATETWKVEGVLLSLAYDSTACPWPATANANAIFKKPRLHPELKTARRTVASRYNSSRPACSLPGGWQRGNGRNSWWDTGNGTTLWLCDSRLPAEVKFQRYRRGVVAAVVSRKIHGSRVGQTKCCQWWGKRGAFTLVPSDTFGS